MADINKGLDESFKNITEEIAQIVSMLGDLDKKILEELEVNMNLGHRISKAEEYMKGLNEGQHKMTERIADLEHRKPLDSTE